MASDAAAGFREVNFDGLIGPTHNYAGLSLGNLAATRNAGAVARPRDAALQGLAKMRRLMALGVRQGFLLPHDRPATCFLRDLGFTGDDAAVLAAAWRADPVLLANAASASAMWTANAATVSPAPDTRDGRCHLSIANLSTMLHRSIEPPGTHRQLATIFADTRHFAVHGPLPARLGDEGAANHMRLAPGHGAPGLELFVYGNQQHGAFPARQHKAASEAVARRHGLDLERTLFVAQSDAAIQAGAFHNDVVAVANAHVLFAHEHAFADRAGLHAAIAARCPEAVVIEAPADRLSLADAVQSYLFNAQLVSLADTGMALIVPAEVGESERVWAWVSTLTAGNGPIRRIEVIDVRESMRNGGGPACLRLRVAVDDAAHAAIDPRFLLDERKADTLAEAIARHWPATIAPDDLGDAGLWQACVAARRALLAAIGVDPAEV